MLDSKSLLHCGSIFVHIFFLSFDYVFLFSCLSDVKTINFTVPTLDSSTVSFFFFLKNPVKIVH